MSESKGKKFTWDPPSRSPPSKQNGFVFKKKNKGTRRKPK